MKPDLDESLLSQFHAPIFDGAKGEQATRAMPVSDAGFRSLEGILVSLLPPSPTLRRAALAVSTFLLAAFVITIPFAEVMLPRLNIYIPLVATVMFLNDLITASLLLVQFSIARSRTLLLLANGYLFTALVAAVYGLVWPGAFHPTGLFGAGPETPPWLYLVWHAGLPTSVIVYALLKSKEYETPPVTRDSVRTLISASITCNILIVCGLTWFVTRFHDVLPILVMSGDRASAFSHFGTGAILIVSIGALVLQWRGRRRSVLDLWLSVVTLAWLLGAIMLTAIRARYDVAWYATPAFLVVSAIPVLLVLLSESLMLHAQFDLKLLLENKRAEEKLRRNRHYLAEAQRLSHIGSWAFNATGFGHWSPELFKIHGLDPGGKAPSIPGYLALVHPEDRDFVAQEIEKMLAGAEGFDFKKRIVRPDGAIRHVRCVGIRATTGGIVQEFIGTGMDVTEHELLTQELRRREAYLAEAQRLSHTGSFGWKPDTGDIIWSAETYRIFEYDRAVTPTIDLVAQRVHPEDRADFQSVIERASEGASDFEHAYRLLLPDGRAKHVHALAHATEDASGNREFVGAVTDITDHKRAEESLRASEAYLAEAQRLSQTGSWAWAPDQDIRYWSEECYRVLSFDPQDGLPRFEDFFRRIHPDDQPGFMELIQTAIREKAEWEADYRIVHPDCPVRDIHVVGHPVLSTSRHLVEFVGTVIDITDRKRAEEELRRSQHYLAEAQKVSHTGSWAWSPVSNAILYWSEECYRILGYDPAHGLPSFESSLERIHPEDRPALAATIERAVREKAEFQIEYRLVLPDGTRRNVRILSHPVLDASGKLVEFVGTVMDVTEQKRAEEEHREHLWFLESMDRINRAMQRSNELELMMSGVLEETLAIFGSDRAWLVYPCDPDAVTSRVVMEHTRPEYPGAFVLGEEFPVDTQAAELLRRVLDGPGAVTDLSVPPKIRARFRIESIIAIAVRPKGDRPYLFGLHQCSHARAWTAAERRLFEEIARRLEDALTSVLAHRNLLASQEALRTSQERFRTFADHATDAFFLFDDESIVRDVNCQACESLGYAREELIGMHVSQFSVESTPERMTQIEQGWEQLHLHGHATVNSLRRRKDGSTFPVEVRVRAFKRGGRTWALALANDITERKHAEAERLKLEERLRQAEKMEAIGRFASGIAHDFNNVLGGIIAYGEMLFDDAPESSPRHRYAQNVLTAATRGRDLVDQILAYTRSQRGKRVPTDVCRTVAETLELIRSSLPARITLHPIIPDAPLVVMGNATQLHQIVTNLCTNAIHAMKAGGPLRVAVTPLDVGADRALSHGRLKPGGYARLSIEDGGCGMDEATLARIFEPFFTTKEMGRGTGLGLSLVYAIVTDFGGVIDVKSAPDEGSTFSIYFPVADAPLLLT